MQTQEQETKKESRRPKNIALLDMDGVVCDWHNQLRKDSEKLLGEDLGKISPETLTKIEHLIRSQTGWYENLVPLPLGFKIAETLREIGFTIMMATKATLLHENAWTEKARWCKKYLPYTKMTVSEDKTIMYGKILVDDYPKFAGPWLDGRPRGYVIMPDQPWNQDYEHPRVKRVRTPEDVEALRPFLIEIFNR